MSVLLGFEFDYAVLILSLQVIGKSVYGLKDALCISGEIKLLGPRATLEKERLFKCLLVDSWGKARQWNGNFLI